MLGYFTLDAITLKKLHLMHSGNESNHCQAMTHTCTWSYSPANGVVVLSTWNQEEEVRPTNIGLYSGPGGQSGTSQSLARLLMPWQHFPL